MPHWHLIEAGLQNDDAILTNKFLSSRVSRCWRLAAILFRALPLALSVRYKQFPDGQSSTELYGVLAPTVGNWRPTNDPIYLPVRIPHSFCQRHFASERRRSLSVCVWI